MSQSKISRIESGKALPTVVDVDRILTAFEVPADVAAELLSLARQANVAHTSWRAVAETGFWRKQIELKALAESCSVQRHFLPAMPSGIMQVPDYARTVLTARVPSDPAIDTDKAVEARLERQKTLADESGQFVFLLTEQAVRWRFAERTVMARQCEHMARVAELPNVSIAIIPQSAEVAGPALNSYVVYDDRLVIAELYSGEVALRDPKDVTHHLELFEFFAKHALHGSRATAFLLAARDDFM